MSYCVDSNILLRWAEPDTAACKLARDAVNRLKERGETVFITPQNLVEFWTVATRPREVNGLGMTIAQAAGEIRQAENLFPLLPDTAAIHDEWRRIVVTHKVSGLRTHDARIAAALRVHGVSNILTFNVADFQPFGNPAPVHPSDIVDTTS